MSQVDVNEYKEVAAHALDILQDIMNSTVTNDIAKAIAATTVLEHCKSVIERERQKRSYIPNLAAKEMEKCIKNVIDGMPDNGGLAQANTYR